MMNSLIEYSNSIGDLWAARVLTTLIDSTAILVLTSLLWLIIRKRVAPQVGYCLFLLVPLVVCTYVSPALWGARYHIATVSREGVKTVNKKPLPSE